MKNLTIKIQGKEYQIACPAEREAELHNAANYLDQKMTEIRNNGRIISFEGVLMTAAINLSYDLLKQTMNTEDLDANLTFLGNKLDTVLQTKNLNKPKNLEFEKQNPQSLIIN